MPVFNNLNNIKPMEDPEEREAQEIQRTDKKYDKKLKARKTSVTSKKYYYAMRTATILGIILIIATICYATYKGIDSFIPRNDEGNG